MKTMLAGGGGLPEDIEKGGQQGTLKHIYQFIFST